MITDKCQRWELGREFRRPAGETIRAAECEVVPITAAEADAFVSTHHYAKSCSPPAHPFGLMWRGDHVGTAVFGPLASMNAHRKVFPTLSTKEAFTLGRLVLLDGVPGNGESLFVSGCFDLLRDPKRYKPLDDDGNPRVPVVAIESCSDPEPRMSVDGKRVHRGHVGTVYQALGAQHVGKTNPATLWLLPDGTVFSNKASGKVFRSEQGRGYSGDKLVDFGADPIEPGEDPQEWLRYWRPRIVRNHRHQGNFRYIWSLSDKRRREVIGYTPAREYPKIGWAS